MMWDTSIAVFNYLDFIACLFPRLYHPKILSVARYAYVFCMAHSRKYSAQKVRLLRNRYTRDTEYRILDGKG